MVLGHILKNGGTLLLVMSLFPILILIFNKIKNYNILDYGKIRKIYILS